MSHCWMLFVQGEDKPGIVEAVTGLLYEAGANLEDISMTLIEGQFAMMLSFQASKAKADLLQGKIKKFSIKPWNLFYNLVLIQQRKLPLKKDAKKRVIVTAIGKDRTGIVYRLSAGLAKMFANIINLDCRLLSRKDGKNLYSVAMEVELKKANDFKKIEKLIQFWEKDLGIEAHVHSSESAVF